MRAHVHEEEEESQQDGVGSLKLDLPGTIPAIGLFLLLSVQDILLGFALPRGLDLGDVVAVGISLGNIGWGHWWAK